MTNFNYKSSDGILNIKTLSPSEKYFYKVQQPKALNPSAFGSKIAFFNLNNELIYHRSNVYAHELHSKKEIELGRQKMERGEPDISNTNRTLVLVKWSKEGNLAYYLEHYRWNYKVLYESVFLHLADRFCYRVNEVVDEFKIVEQLQLDDKKFEENKILAQLQSLGLKKEEEIKDSISRSLFEKLLGMSKWHPI